MSRRCIQRITICVAVIGSLFFQVQPIGAQSRSFNLSTGLFNFDLSGTGNTALAGASVDWAVAGNWLIEGGMTLAFPQQQFGDRTTFLIPEVQLHYQWPRGRFAPFAGGGIGAAIDIRDDFFGGTDTDLALSGGGGLRVNLTDNVGIRGEFRLRGFEADFGASAAEVRGGVFWRF